jgi:hypothetical protein
MAVKPFGGFEFNCVGCPDLTKHMISKKNGCGDLIADILLNADKLKRKGENAITIYAKGIEMHYVGFPHSL